MKKKEEINLLKKVFTWRDRNSGLVCQIIDSQGITIPR